MPPTPRKTAPELAAPKLSDGPDSNTTDVEVTDDERAALKSETDATGEDGYQRNADGNIVNPDDNEYALVVDTQGEVTQDPNRE